MISSVTALANSTATNASATSGKSMSELGQNDFFRLLTVQIQQQDLSARQTQQLITRL